MESPRLSREEAAQLLGAQERADPTSAGARGAAPERVTWEVFAAYLDAEWEAGQSVSIFAPTEGGKTHLIRWGLLPHWQRYPVLWIRFKPRDRTLTDFGRLVTEYPRFDMRVRYQVRPLDSPKWASDPEHFVIVLPKYRWSPDGKRQSESWQKARRIAGTALDSAYQEGGWVVVIDEVRALADGKEPALALSAPMENAWQRGRDQPLTLIAGTQEPVEAPGSMYTMARWVFMGQTHDVGRYQRISEIGGNTAVIKAVLPTLQFQEFLAVDRRYGRMWIVKAPAGRGAA